MNSRADEIDVTCPKTNAAMNAATAMTDAGTT